jgi:hypothetical protein
MQPGDFVAMRAILLLIQYLIYYRNTFITRRELQRGEFVAVLWRRQMHSCSSKGSGKDSSKESSKETGDTSKYSEFVAEL